MLRMLRYEERLYDLLVSKSGLTEGITETEAQSICNALEMDNTSGLNYLSKEEVINLSCISADKKKMLWKLVKAVKKDRRFAADLRISYEDIANIIKNIKGI
jgi:ribosomal protein S13